MSSVAVFSHVAAWSLSPSREETHNLGLCQSVPDGTADSPSSYSMFQYSPLSSPTAFRLIRLTPDTKTDLVGFSLSEHDFDNVPEYKALSYRWGDSSKSRTIKLDGKDLRLHENLWHFLHQLKIENDNGFYWTDAICINQDDIPERNQQVAQMAEIYSLAGQVVVWLGHNRHTEHCLSTVCQSSTSQDLYQEDQATRDLAVNNACAELLSLAYWGRAWVVQEIALAQEIWIKCLSVGCGLAALQSSCQQLRTLEYFKTDARNEFGHGPIVPGYHENTNHGLELLHDIKSWEETGFNFEQWLKKLEDFSCKDKRDLVYSVLGLYRRTGACTSPGCIMAVDYNRTLDSVHWDCVFMLLSNHECYSDVCCNHVADSWHRLIHDERGMLATDNTTITSLCSYILDPTIPEQRRAFARVTLFAIIAFSIVLLLFSEQYDFESSSQSIEFSLSRASALSQKQMAVVLGSKLAVSWCHKSEQIHGVIRRQQWFHSAHERQPDRIESMPEVHSPIENPEILLEVVLDPGSQRCLERVSIDMPRTITSSQNVAVEHADSEMPTFTLYERDSMDYRICVETNINLLDIQPGSLILSVPKPNLFHVRRSAQGTLAWCRPAMGCACVPDLETYVLSAPVEEVVRSFDSTWRWPDAVDGNWIRSAQCPTPKAKSAMQYGTWVPLKSVW